MTHDRQFLLCFSAIALGLVAASCNKAEGAPATNKAKKTANETPVAVATAKVELQDMPKIITLLGNVMADRQSDVAANAAGRVLHAPIERGQTVKAGETLMMLDSKAANLSASAASAQADLADTQLAQAQEDCARAERLFAQGAMVKAEFDRQHTQCKAQALQATAARAQAGLSLKVASDAIVRAPFSGVIGERYVNVGEYVQPQTRIASLYSLDPVRILISVPEYGVSHVHEGVTLNAKVSAWPDRSFSATVDHISPVLRTVQRDLIVEAKAANPDGALRPGMFATIEVAMRDERVPTVPNEAVLADGDVRRLFLVKEGRAFELVVRTGLAREGRTVIYEDLAAGTVVIAAPPADLRDGMLLDLSDASHAANTTSPSTSSPQTPAQPQAR